MPSLAGRRGHLRAGRVCQLFALALIAARRASPLSLASRLPARRTLPSSPRAAPPRCARGLRFAGLPQLGASHVEIVPPAGRGAAAGKEAMPIGGQRIGATHTALVAGLAVLLLCQLGEVTNRHFGLPLWGPPLGGVSLLFAAEATAAAGRGDLASPAAIAQRALACGSACGGGAVVAVLLTKLLGATPLTRAAVITGSSLFMTAFPQSGFFPPAGAMCALYVDQVIGKGPLGSLGLTFALFPCAFGTIFLLLATRAMAFAFARPLRWVEGSKLERRAAAASSTT